MRDLSTLVHVQNALFTRQRIWVEILLHKSLHNYLPSQILRFSWAAIIFFLSAYPQIVSHTWLVTDYQLNKCSLINSHRHVGSQLGPSFQSLPEESFASLSRRGSIVINNHTLAVMAFPQIQHSKGQRNASFLCSKWWEDVGKQNSPAVSGAGHTL